MESFEETQVCVCVCVCVCAHMYTHVHRDIQLSKHEMR